VAQLVELVHGLVEESVSIIHAHFVGDEHLGLPALNGLHLLVEPHPHSPLTSLVAVLQSHQRPRICCELTLHNLAQVRHFFETVGVDVLW